MKHDEETGDDANGNDDGMPPNRHGGWTNDGTGKIEGKAKIQTWLS